MNRRTFFKSLIASALAPVAAKIAPWLPKPKAMGGMVQPDTEPFMTGSCAVSFRSTDDLRPMDALYLRDDGTVGKAGPVRIGPTLGVDADGNFIIALPGQNSS